MKEKEELPEDLLGDIIPEIDPKKLFDEKEYATIVIGGDNMTKTDTLNADDITSLISPRTSREEKDEALKQLKDHQAQAFMVHAISKTKNVDHKAVLVSACWEIGLDFSNYYLEFIHLICHQNFTVSLEAFTVIQEMQNSPSDAILNQSLTELKKVKAPSSTVLDAIELLTNQLNAE